MNRLLIVAILMLSTAPLYAQGQRENIAKLKEDALNAVGIIGADRRKTQSYCEIVDFLGRQLGRTDKEKNKKKTKALAQRISVPKTVLLGTKVDTRRSRLQMSEYGDG